MPGQPQVPPWLTLDVTNLEVTAEPGPAPSIIVKTDATFDLSATFEGHGVIWSWLENISFPYQVSFYAEGLGANADEEDLGSIAGTLAPGGSPYTATMTVPANKLDPGVYKMACIVTFKPNAPGMTGFYDQLLIEVYD